MRQHLTAKTKRKSITSRCSTFQKGSYALSLHVLQRKSIKGREKLPRDDCSFQVNKINSFTRVHPLSIDFLQAPSILSAFFKCPIHVLSTFSLQPWQHESIVTRTRSSVDKNFTSRWPLKKFLSQRKFV